MRDGAEQSLTGGSVARGVVRVGDTVRRPIRLDPTIPHALLRHLEKAGFDGAPRLLGIDWRGREILSLIAGTPGAPSSPTRRIDDAGIAAAARLLRRFHDATAGTALAAGCEVVCHNDWTPANTLLRDGAPVALVDFELAAPGSRLWDLGYGAFHWLDLGYPQHTAAEQHRRLDLLAAAYDWPGADAAAVAVHAVARITLTAADLRSQGEAEYADWAGKCAAWTAQNLAQPLVAGRRLNP